MGMACCAVILRATLTSVRGKMAVSVTAGHFADASSFIHAEGKNGAPAWGRGPSPGESASGAGIRASGSCAARGWRMKAGLSDRLLRLLPLFGPMWPFEPKAGRRRPRRVLNRPRVRMQASKSKPLPRGCATLVGVTVDGWMRGW
eukprot:7386071-Prymnesium_polylepis.1